MQRASIATRAPLARVARVKAKPKNKRHRGFSRFNTHCFLKKIGVQMNSPSSNAIVRRRLHYHNAKVAFLKFLQFVTLNDNDGAPIKVRLRRRMPTLMIIAVI